MVDLIIDPKDMSACILHKLMV